MKNNTHLKHASIPHLSYKDVKVKEYIIPDCPKTHSTVVGDLQKCKLML